MNLVLSTRTRVSICLFNHYTYHLPPPNITGTLMITCYNNGIAILRCSPSLSRKRPRWPDPLLQWLTQICFWFLFNVFLITSSSSAQSSSIQSCVWGPCSWRRPSARLWANCSDAGGLSPSVDAVDIAGDWPALPLAGLDSAGYLASKPNFTAQRGQFQPLPDQVNSVKLAPETDNIGCASSPSLPVSRTKKRKLLQERQNVQNECPNPMPLTGPTSGSAGSASQNKPNENPRLYPGGQKRRIPDWFFGIQQE